MPNGKRGSKKTAEDLVFNTVVGRNIKYLRKIKNFNQTKSCGTLQCEISTDTKI